MRRFSQWLFSNNHSDKKRSKQKRSKRRQRRMSGPLQFDCLESRRLLAFSFGFDGATLFLNQTMDDGIVMVDNDGPGNAFRVTDGSGTNTFLAAPSVVINLLDGTGQSLELKLNQAHTGNVALNLGDGDRNVEFSGTMNAIGNSLFVTGGNGNQTIGLAKYQTLTVDGNLRIDLGNGDDRISDTSAGIDVGGNWNFFGVNDFENEGIMNVLGDVTIDSRGEVETTIFDDDWTMSIGGNFTFLGGDGRDEITLNGTNATGSSIGGNAFIQLGGSTGSGAQYVYFNYESSSIGGALNVNSTNQLSSDIFQMVAGSSVGQNLNLNLGGGGNSAYLAGEVGGNYVGYVGGSGRDRVDYNLTGNDAFVNATLGAGDDAFMLRDQAKINLGLRVQFGGDASDQFINELGAFDFNASLLNLDGFTRYYSNALDQWNLLQLADLGNVTLGNGGANDPIRLTHSKTTELSPASTLRITMLSNSGNLTVDLDSPLTKDLILSLGHGERLIQMVGQTNSIGGNFIFDAADDSQTVELTVTTALVVGKSAVFNMRNGFDNLVTNENAIIVGESLIFRGVNEFENEGNLTAGAWLINTSFETEDSEFDNDGVIQIEDTLIYIGGDGGDEVSFNTSTTVGGNVTIDVGNYLVQQGLQYIGLSDFYAKANVTVLGGISQGSNSFQASSTNQIDGNLFVDFSRNPWGNEIGIGGRFNGDQTFIRGGRGLDLISLDELRGRTYFIAQMGQGNDRFVLSSLTRPKAMFLDFGAGEDVFVDEYEGNYPFDLVTRNLP